MPCRHIVFAILGVILTPMANSAPMGSMPRPIITMAFDNLIYHTNETTAKRTTTFDTQYNRTFGTFTAIAVAEPTGSPTTAEGKGMEAITARSMHNPPCQDYSVNGAATWINDTWIALNHTNVMSILPESFYTEPEKGYGKSIQGDDMDNPKKVNKQIKDAILRSLRNRMPPLNCSNATLATVSDSPMPTTIVVGQGQKVNASINSTTASEANPNSFTKIDGGSALNSSTIAISTPGDLLLGQGFNSTATGSATNSSGTETSDSCNGYVPSSTCEPEGLWHCFCGGTSFQRCGNGIWSAVLHVAEGTTCLPGKVNCTHGNAIEKSKRAVALNATADETKVVESRVITPDFKRPEMMDAAVDRKTINHPSSLLPRDLASIVITPTKSPSTPHRTLSFPGFPTKFGHGPVVPGRGFNGQSTSHASNRISVITTRTSKSFPGFQINFGYGPVVSGREFSPSTLTTARPTRNSASFPGFSTNFGHGPVVPGRGFHPTNHSSSNNSTTTTQASNAHLTDWHTNFGHGPVVLPGIYRLSSSNTTDSITPGLTRASHKWFGGHGPRHGSGTPPSF
jgi:hypothetical protein